MIKKDLKSSESIERPSERLPLHPLKTLLFFCMAASGLLFLVMLSMYTAQRFHGANAKLSIELPKFFVLSTLCMVGSSVLITYCQRAFGKEKLKQALFFSSSALITGLAFLFCQAWGWMEFFSMGFGFPTVNVASSYVYVISGIHFAHMIGGLSALSYMIFQHQKILGDPVKELIFFTNPFEKTKVDLIAAYWHFTDVVWLILFVYFLLTF
jgi:cytochrome c oxidase subunit 3